ncbi:response regulator [Chitinophaga oryzae]|uniref:Response regulator n=1 Tax=Chitinophaga oryzae TaxID=2725414 RepID=A0ABX6LNJ7_9BACT|nr:response regulator [Chitinophaga oryzae]QJB41721.1 response regulator [Chitinophaga oryzae]
MKVDILLVDAANECPCSTGFVPYLINRNYIIDRRPNIYTCIEAFADQEREYGVVIVHMSILAKSLRVVRKIREQNASIPIIVITFIGRGPTDIHAITEAGADDYIIKPMCGPGYLIEVIGKYLPHKQ